MAKAEQPARARADGKPWRLRFSDWKTLVIRAWREQTEDNIGLIAAGVAFYGFLALVPLLAATVLTYGMIASPQTVVDNVRHLMEVVPASAATLIGDQLMHVVDTSGGKKGLGLLVALAIALFGARNGAGALITALTIAYEEEETRSYLHVTLLALAITAAGVLFAIVAALAIGVIGFVEDLIPFATGFFALVGKALTYALLAAAGAAMAATLYRYGPARHHVGWEWLTPGSLLSTAGWVILTLGFGLYVSHFGNYNATYGSLSAVIVLLTWLYLSSYIFLFGAELNSEVEKLLDNRASQSATDSNQNDLVPPSGPRTPIVASGRHSAPAPTAEKRGPGLAVPLLSACGLLLLCRRDHAGRGATLLGLALIVTAWRQTRAPSARP